MIDARFFVTIFHGAGELDIIPVSLFKRSDTEGILTKYKKGSGPDPIKIDREAKGISVGIYCNSCQRYSFRKFLIGDLYRKDGHFVYCDSCNVELGFLGRKKYVKDVVSKRKKKIEFLIREMGLDNFFKDPVVVYELINYIHYMVESRSLKCECGNSDIKADLSFDKIELFCQECGNKIKIDARNREDLNKIKEENYIVITH